MSGIPAVGVRAVDPPIDDATAIMRFSDNADAFNNAHRAAADHAVHNYTVNILMSTLRMAQRDIQNKLTDEKNPLVLDASHQAFPIEDFYLAPTIAHAESTDKGVGIWVGTPLAHQNQVSGATFKPDRKPEITLFSDGHLEARVYKNDENAENILNTMIKAAAVLQREKPQTGMTLKLPRHVPEHIARKTVNTLLMLGYPQVTVEREGKSVTHKYDRQTSYDQPHHYERKHYVQHMREMQSAKNDMEQKIGSPQSLSQIFLGYMGIADSKTCSKKECAAAEEHLRSWFSRCQDFLGSVESHMATAAQTGLKDAMFSGNRAAILERAQEIHTAVKELRDSGLTAGRLNSPAFRNPENLLLGKQTTGSVLDNLSESSERMIKALTPPAARSAAAPGAGPATAAGAGPRRPGARI